MSEWKMRRFWRNVAVSRVGAGFAVALDTRPVRTPGKAPLAVPSRALADAVAAEWAAQGDAVDPATMPVTRAANSAIDKVAPQRDAVARMLAEYGGTDLLCYRADGPQGLVDAQAAGWDPMLDWAERTYGARLRITTGVMPIAQDRDVLERLAEPLFAMSPFELTGVHDLVTLSGSLVLALAVAEGGHDADAIWALSRIDEEWQVREWGRDDEAEAAAAAKRRDFLAAHRFLDLVREPG